MTITYVDMNIHVYILLFYIIFCVICNFLSLGETLSSKQLTTVYMCFARHLNPETVPFRPQRGSYDLISFPVLKTADGSS